MHDAREDVSSERELLADLVDLVKRDLGLQQAVHLVPDELCEAASNDRQRAFAIINFLRILRF